MVHHDAVGLQQLGLADARELEDLRRADGAGAEGDLARDLGFRVLATT